jgi:hypothetical protein
MRTDHIDRMPGCSASLTGRAIFDPIVMDLVIIHSRANACPQRALPNDPAPILSTASRGTSWCELFSGQSGGMVVAGSRREGIHREVLHGNVVLRTRRLTANNIHMALSKGKAQ